MGTRLVVTERLRGFVGRRDLAEDVRLELELDIDDLDRFVAGRPAVVRGHVDCDALGGWCRIVGGSLEVVGDPAPAQLRYRAELEDPRGHPFTMLGRKALRGAPAPDPWAPAATLELWLFEGHGATWPAAPAATHAWEPPPAAAGLAHLELLDGVRRALSFEAPGSAKAEADAAAQQFCTLHGAHFWDLYNRPPRRMTGPMTWTASEAFEAARRRGAVKWLLAGDLLRNAARIARSTLGHEMDLRDWMSPGGPIDLRQGWSAYLRAPDPAHAAEAPGELWFDYIADTGDHLEVMERLASLMKRRLTADELAQPGELAPDRDLEVGPFVFFGGDTAYHISDELTLRERVVQPFQRALGRRGERGEQLELPCERLLFGIPGNHDYYDNLVGFNRMFRRPFRAPEGVLQIPGHALRQEASYVKILLPGGWQLWGVDLASGLDFRQWRYFGEVPDKLILCVAAPPLAFGKVQVPADPEDARHKAYHRLFNLPEGAEVELAPEAVARSLAPGQCRLHIAGDEHHYVRYDSAPAGPATTPATGGAAPPSHAVTVVSGGGGAFLHPTETRLGDLARTRPYPSVETSSKLTAGLVNPKTTFSGGLIWAVGAVLAALLCASFPESRDAAAPAGIWLATVVAAFGALYGAYRMDRRIALAVKRVAKELRSRTAKEAAPEPVRVTWLDRALVYKVFRPIVWTGAIAFALSAPFLAKLGLPDLDPLSSASVFVMLAAAMALAFTALAKARGLSYLGGVAHAVVQIGMPIGLVLAGTWRGYLIVAVLVLAFVACAGKLYRAQHAHGVRRERRGFAWLLALLWVLQGPVAVAALWAIPAFRIEEPLLAREWSELPGAEIAAAAIVGVFVSTAQFSWYLLVAAAFGAHNNEAGAALRTSKYKQWIRFHVTRDVVTGYVIGIDDPIAGSPPKLVDVFRVGPKPKPPDS